MKSRETQSDLTKIRNKRRMSTLSMSIQYSTQSSNKSSKAKKERKKFTKLERKKPNFHYFADAMKVYIRDSKILFQRIPTAHKHLHQNGWI